MEKNCWKSFSDARNISDIEKEISREIITLEPFRMKGMIERSESKVSLCYSQGLGAFQQSIRKRDVVISAYGVFVDD